MAFHLEFETDNAAFVDRGAENEVVSILRRVELRLDQGRTEGWVSDSNGNVVGRWELSP